MLGSKDIENLTIQLRSPEEILFDFGHIDIFIAENAPELVWEPLLSWIEEHSRGRRDGREIAWGH